MISLTTVAPAGSKALDFVSFTDYVHAKENGVTVLLRYLKKTGTLNKQLTPAQRDATFAAGLAILMLWERDTNTASKGSAQGAKDGREAGIAALNIGYPQGMPIIAAVDFDVTPFNIGSVRGYLESFRAQILTFGYTLGVYGGSVIIKACLDISVCNHIANAKSWSRNPPWPGTNTVPEGKDIPERLTLPINFIQYYHVDWNYENSAGVTYDADKVAMDTTVWYPHEVADPIPSGEPIMITRTLYVPSYRAYDSRDPKGANPFTTAEKRYIYMGADAESAKIIGVHAEGLGAGGGFIFYDGTIVPPITSLGYANGYGQSFVYAPLVANPATGQLGHVCVYATRGPSDLVIDVVSFGYE